MHTFIDMGASCISLPNDKIACGGVEQNISPLWHCYFVLYALHSTLHCVHWSPKTPHRADPKVKFPKA